MSENEKIPGRWTLRFCLLGGGLAWFLHLMGAWALVEFGVLAGAGPQPPLLIALSVATFAVAAAAMAVSAGVGKRVAEPADEAARTARFCARFGVPTNAVFAFIIAAQTVPVFFYLLP